MLATVRQITHSEYKKLQLHASQEPDFVFLGSTADGPGRGNLSGFSCAAVSSLVITTEVSDRESLKHLGHKIEAHRSSLAPPRAAPGALVGGWVGFASYELGYWKESRLQALRQPIPLPLFQAGLYLWTASRNQQTGSCTLWVHPQCPEAVTDKLVQWLAQPLPSPTRQWRMTAPFAARQSAEEFKASLNRVQAYITAGDCYQANLSQAFSGQYCGTPWLAYQALTESHPTPYGAFLRAGKHSILSASPERFLAIENGTVKTSPIKGTRPRGDTPDADLTLARNLQSSEKDRAENLMIVDLLRNDLGLNARPGSVAVDELFALESYRNVHHLVSHIRASLKSGVSPFQAFLDAFPGGSITGAPKIRAMEIIRELEPHWRGPYCGSVFYYGLDGRFDSSIAIRTLLCSDDGTVHCWGGGGIVADSDPDSEYQETLDKVGPLMRFLEELVIN